MKRSGAVVCRELPLEGTFFAGILHMQNDGLSDMVRSDHTSVLYGKDYFYEELLGLGSRSHRFPFSRLIPRGQRFYTETAREYLGDIEGNVVFDLYSGTRYHCPGTGTGGKKVVGVEIVEEAVVAARENAKKKSSG